MKMDDGLIIKNRLYFKVNIPKYSACMYYNEYNDDVTIGMFYQFSEFEQKNQIYSLLDNEFFFADYALKADDKSLIKTVNESLHGDDLYFKNLKHIYRLKVENCIKQKDKEGFKICAKLYTNLKNEMECLI